MNVAANLSRIRETLAGADVTLIAVSKYVGTEAISEAVKCGVTEFGESRVTDALQKQEQLSDEIAQKAHWHFIGHLQTNKVKKVVGRFTLIHSVDSMRLAEELSQEATKRGLSQAILLQVKIVEDPNKTGFTPQELQQQFSRLLEMPGIKIQGLMTITPLTDDQSILKKCFSGLAALREELEQKHAFKLKHLSMGMSDDWMEAVKYGATMIRLGRAIFEN
ncbi:MAG: YggS family pyridoxal phosphate-dependent enzyme [Candidatus Obscuribacterales bacterium]|nr:YggS family pyridoxal phosphate-dependent enzyme [Candidatus Obscuribacterales bacterium]